MKVMEAIDRIDSLKHNTYTNAEKIDWLSRLDGLIKYQIIDTHEGGEDIVFDGYTEKDMQKELLIKDPFDDVYIRWLEAQIDYYNGEIARYNNSIQMYQAAFDSYQRFYNRNHTPNGYSVKYFGGVSSNAPKAKSIVEIKIEEV